MGKKRSVTPNGNAVRSARLRRAWTTDDLAGRSDCAVKTIENAERGKPIYANTLALIARALEVEYDSLIASPVEQKTSTSVEQKKDRKLSPMISTTRVSATIGILAKENQPIDTDWFLEQLKSHVSFQDVIDVLDNRYGQAPGIPEGGVWITLKMTVRDFYEVYDFVEAKSKSNELFLKVAFVCAESIPNPHIRDRSLWLSPLLYVEPPHSHLYD